ncbi:MAG TPA: type VI secretion system baseplate subunit TssE, partial [Thermoanaerobaculia bacterium]
EQLFNTRCPVPAHRLAVRERTVIDYGIPDFSTFSARNQDDRLRLAETLRRAIETYEPRLADVRVHVDVAPGDDFSLIGSIEAKLRTDRVEEPVSFMTVLEMKEGRAEVR